MRLIGFRFDEADGPVSEGFLPLGQLTSILGANDAGKSRLLRMLASALTSPPTVRARFYAELSPNEISRMLRAARWTEWVQDHRPADLVRWTLSAIESSRADRPGWVELCSELACSSLFAFETAGVTDPSSWNVAWCLPAFSMLDTRLPRLPLDGLGRPDAEAKPKRRPVKLEELTGDRFVTPWQMEASPFEPYPLASLGAVPVSWLPAPINFPTTDQALATAATRVISELVRELGWHELVYAPLSALIGGSRDDEVVGMVEVLPLVDPARHVPADPTRRSWLERPDADTVRLSGDVTAARAFIERYANSVVPSPIRDAYDLKTEISPDAVLSDSPITFRLGRRGADPEGPLSSFGTSDAAEGHQIWIQLAFAEATAVLRDLAARLSDLAASVFVEIDDIAMLELELEDTERDLDGPRRELGGSSVAIGANEAPVPDGTEGSIADAQNAVEDARLRLIAVARPYLDVVADLRAQVPLDPWAAVRESDWAGPVEVREPLYLIDEPERHLHPLVQAKFAAWMRDLIRVRGAQGALVTHAVPFINKADALAYVRRGGPGSSVRSCSPEELGALGAIATELGLDRGQLLAGVAVILFVEGPSDQHVIEGLFRDRLREIGAAVVPLHGATKLAQVVDSQLLLRYSSAKIATLLDNTTESEIKQLTSDQEYREAATRSPKAERQALARLIVEALAQHRTVTPLGLEAEDIFFLLDADAIRDTFRQLSESDALATSGAATSVEAYPGHDRFRAEFETTAGKNEKWKAFCQRAYGISFYGDVRWFARVAESMRARGTFPPELVEVVDQLERLAL